MKYLAKDTTTNTIGLVFELPVQMTEPLEQIEVADEDWREDMLMSIFIDINNYKPLPRTFEGRWESDGTNWFDARDDSDIWFDIRKNRNNELFDSDWTQLNDSPLTSVKKELWITYRAILRDIPNNNSDPKVAEQILNNTKQNKPGNS